MAHNDGNRKADKVNHHDHESIVPLADFPSEFEANIAAATLKDAGIDARVEVLRLGAYSSSLGGVIRVVVFENDLERARALLAEQ
ncbi:MAG TPA: DUF2007 domain-containing protein [Acidimicrobiia bacterium]|nr:DUF2007 domain-containing protein [Acidimicrobiia bacterium]